ncbi:hypothetical protein [Argonema galeatum]|nr:hypothetical protein [Argonema galeatum]MCL1469030.1 hypothetical protein [Argonema galeatum A003/A1]
MSKRKSSIQKNNRRRRRQLKPITIEQLVSGIQQIPTTQYVFTKAIH